MVNYVRDHLLDVVEQGRITDPPMQTALIDELGYQLGEPQDVEDVLDNYDQREIVGKRPLVGVLGRFALLALKPHYMDCQIMFRCLQPIFAPNKLASAFGRSLVTDAYDTLYGDCKSGSSSMRAACRAFALRHGLGQTALLGTPQVTAIRQVDSPVTLLWLGDGDTSQHS